MFIYLLIHIIQGEITVLHTSLSTKLTCANTINCNLDGWTQSTSPNILNCPTFNVAYNILDATNKNMYRGLSYYYPRVQFIVWFDIFYYGVWNNEQITIKYNNAVITSYTYTSPTTYPYSGEFCDSLSYDVQSKKLPITTQNQGNFQFLTTSINGKAVIRNFIYAVEKCHWSCKACSNGNTCTQCYTSLNAQGTCVPCQYYTDPTGCVTICDFNKYPNNDNYCVDVSEVTLVNDQFKNAAPMVQWIKISDTLGYTTLLKCAQYFGLLTGSEGMQKIITQSTQYLHWLRIKVILYLFGTIPLKNGIVFSINGNYITQLYNNNGQIIMDYNGYIMKKSALTCTDVGNGQQYILMLHYPVPIGDFIMRIQSNWQQSTTLWGITQIQINIGRCQQECLQCTYEYVCQQCKVGYYLYKGKCMNTLPIDYLNLNTTHIITYDLEQPYSEYLVNDLYNYYIKNDPDSYFVYVSGNYLNFLTSQKSSGLYTKKVFGGPYVWSNAKFTQTYTITTPHYGISIRMKIILSDLFTQQFIIQFDSDIPETITTNSPIDLFGKSTQEYQINKYWYINHNINTFTITIECQGDGNLLHSYCAISDYSIVIHNCSPFCLICNDAYTCTSYDSNYALAKFNQLDCLSNEYLLNYNCYTCQIECLTCISLDYCTSCINNLYLYNGKCICQQGQYLDTQQCYNCNSYCQACIQQNYCIKCIESTKRISINGLCQCETGFYEYNNQCIKCHNNCLTCSGTTIYDCIDCDISKHFILSTICICQDGYYLSYGQCLQCHYSCLTCFGSELNQCLTCQLTRQLNGLTCICQLGYFETYSTLCTDCPIIENSIYSDCYYNCNSIQQWHNIICTYIPTCLITQQIINNQCISKCGDLIVMPDEECDDLSTYCYNCKYQCPLYCPNCYNTTCLDICGDGYVTGTEQCDDAITTITCNSCLYGCQTQCSECLDGKCYKCNATGYILQNNKCIEHCGDGLKVGNEECDDMNSNSEDGCDNCKFRCRSDCLECSANRRYCLTCMNSGYKIITTLPNSYKCAPVCGDGLKISNKFETEQCDDGNSTSNDGCSNTCQWQCQPNTLCTSCVNNLCALCVSGYKYVTSKNICIPICGDGIIKTTEICDDGNNQYYDGCNQQCQLMCQPQCITCTIQGCILCEQGYTINKFNNQCISICGDGYITDNEQCDDLIHSNCYQCKYHCLYGCKLCIYGICLQCNKEFQINQQTRQCEYIIPIIEIKQIIKQEYFNQPFLQYCNVQIQNICLQCEIGFYYNEFNQECIQNNINICTLNCLICYQQQCIQCENNYILLNKQCLKQITYIEQLKCQSSCLNCINGQCLKCKKGYELQINQQCIPICGDQIITNDEQCDDNNQIYDDGCVDCQFQCYGNCLNCYFGKCLNCESPQLLIFDKMQCYDPELCQKGYYVNQQNNTCQNKCGDLIKTDEEECDTIQLCQECQLLCSPNCKYCIDKICYTCEDDYDLDDQYYCQPKQQIKQVINIIEYKLIKTICDQNYCFYQNQPKMILQQTDQKDNLQQFSISFDQQIKMCQDTKAQIYIDNKLYSIINLKNITINEFLIQYNQTTYNPIIEVNVTDCIKNQYEQKLQSQIVNIRADSVILLTQNEQQATTTLMHIANSIQYLILVSLPILLVLGNFSNFLNFIDILQYIQYQQYLNQPPNMEQFLSTFFNLNTILKDIQFYTPYEIETQFHRNGSFISTSIPIAQVYAFTTVAHFSIKIISRMFRQSTLDLRTQNKLLLKIHIYGNKFLHSLNRNSLKQKFQNILIFSGLELCMNSSITMSLGSSVSKQEQYLSSAAISLFFFNILYSIKMPTLISLKKFDSQLNPIPKSPEKYKVNTLIFGQCMKKMLYSVSLVHCHSNPILASLSLCFIDFSYGCFVQKTQPFQSKLENNKVIVQQIYNTLTNGFNVIQSMKLFENTKIVGFVQMAIIVQSLGHTVMNEIWQKRVIFQKMFNLFKFTRVDNPGVVEFLVYE